jgi:nitrogen fixation protein FixH
MSTSMPGTPAVRPLTGRMVLFCLIAFFGTILAMNVVLVRVALSSFGGVETESSYKAGLAFKNDIAASQAQDARHWAVEASLRREVDGTRVAVSARDAEDHPLGGLSIEARLTHPTDKRRDVILNLVETGPGRFETLANAPRGQWDLVIGLKRGNEQVFRSKSRITL